MAYQLNFHHGDQVVVLDDRGDHLCRGRIQGRAPTSAGPVYDVQPDKESSLSKRLVGVPESRLRVVGRPMLVKGASS